MYTITRPVSPMFTGREDVLRLLEHEIRTAVQGTSRQQQCQIVIVGMGGQGKSEICLQIASKLRRWFWGTFWIDVSTQDIAETGFLDVAKQMQVEASSWTVGRQLLTDAQHPWLLVLDNADDPKVDYFQYFPASSTGVVLLTSRLGECEMYATGTPFTLEGLPGKNACELLFRVARIDSSRRQSLEEDAQRIAHAVGYHPLALIQAGAYIARSHCSLQQYPHEFGRQCKRLLKFHPTQARSRHRNVFATFETSAGILEGSMEEDAVDALQLLPVLASFGPSHVPLLTFEAAWSEVRMVGEAQLPDHDLDHLTTWHRDQIPSWLQPNSEAWDPSRLVQALNQLEILSLVTIHTREDLRAVSLHPLIRAWSKERLSLPQQHDIWLRAGSVLALSYGHNRLWIDSRQEMRAHLEAVTSLSMARMFSCGAVTDVCRIIVRCGWFLYKVQHVYALSSLVQRLFAHLCLDLLTVIPQWVDIYELAARDLEVNGHGQRAIELLESIIDIRTKIFLQEEDRLHISEQALARLYRDSGKFDKALKILNEMLISQGQKLIRDHSSRLFSEHTLATTYLLSGQIKKAIVLHEQHVEIQGRKLTEDHPDQVASYWALAIAYLGDGQMTRATALLEKLASCYQKSLEEEHADRLAVEQLLGVVYYTDSRIKEALCILEQVVKIHRQILAPEHPERLSSQHTLGIVYTANGQVNEAVRLLEENVGIQACTLPSTHPERLAAERSLAEAYQATGNIEQARTLLERVVKIKEEVFPEDHFSRLASQQLLGQIYTSFRQYKEATVLLERVTDIRQRTLDEGHFALLAVQESLAVVYHADGQVDRAISLLEHIVRIRERTLPNDHPNLVNIRSALGHAYRGNDQVDQAVTMLKYVVEAREREFPATNFRRFDSQQSLALAYRDNGQFEDAVTLLKHVVDVREQFLAQENPDLLESQQELAETYMANDQPHEALHILKRVVEIHERTLPDDNAKLLGLQLELADAYKEVEQYSNQAELLKRWIHVRQRTEKIDDTALLTAQHNFAMALWETKNRQEAVDILRHVVAIQRESTSADDPERLEVEECLEYYEKKLAKSIAKKLRKRVADSGE